MEFESEKPKPLSNAERRKRFVDKLKATGRYEEYKKKHAENERRRYGMVKDIIGNLKTRVKERLIRIRRDNSRKNKIIERKRKIRISSSSTSNLSGNGYRSNRSLRRAVATAKAALPKTLEKQKSVLMTIFNGLSENTQTEIILNKSTLTKSTAGKSLSKKIIEDVVTFYERDDISRMSPNVRDARMFTNISTGNKELKQIRHLIYPLKEAYGLFIEQFVKNGDASSQPAPLKLSKFCSLRPPHVYLEFPLYGKELMSLLLCSVNDDNCWLRKCVNCSATKIEKTLAEMIQRSNGHPSTVAWLEWEKDDSGKRYLKRSMNGSIEELLNHFVALIDKFLIHSFTKTVQAKAFEQQRNDLDGESAILQVDLAENFTCVSQDEIQSAHWHQKTISLFTISIKLLDDAKYKVFVSDNTEHSKSTVVPFLWKIISGLPKHIKLLNIWTDGPTAQFKNKYIAATVQLFEDLLPLKIVWNFFATSHGKGVVDGLGAIAKHRVHRMVLSRRSIVNCAADFVQAFNMEESIIEVTEVSNSEISRIDAELEMQYVYDNASPVANITSMHKLIINNAKVVGFPTSK